MGAISSAVMQLGALCMLAALMDVCVAGAKLKSGVRLISGLLAVEAIFSLIMAVGATLSGGLI
ncbi:hypothetical protein LJC33_06730 [Eubacteriales bacterium OttesenSCG-928-N13]|nr:hypothetical protein [Eubacteriales bacterium OttesenSCG-928-N13]